MRGEIKIAKGQTKPFNDYTIVGNTVEIHIYSKGNLYKVLVDLEDLDRLKELNRPWHLQWSNKIKDYYIITGISYYTDTGEYKQKTLYLHRFLMNVTKHSEKVHHKDHNPFNNRKYNLEITTNPENSADRQKANSNNKIGVRNVNFIEKLDEYWVQICKNYKRYKWIFPSDQFKEACEFAKEKRREIFGKYSGD